MSWIYLSHALAGDTPLYGGNGSVAIGALRDMCQGDTANASSLSFPAHSGSHIDAPRHFDPQGKTLEDYPAEFWHASRPCLLECTAHPAEVLGLERLGAALESVPQDTDLLLLRTGFEVRRASDPQTYARQGPGLGPDVADWLRSRRSVRMLGFDFISASSFQHRETGRAAHRTFLCAHPSGSAPVLLVEDLALAGLAAAPREVWIAPLRFSRADGAPVTVLARIE